MIKKSLLVGFVTFILMLPSQAAGSAAAPSQGPDNEKNAKGTVAASSLPSVPPPVDNSKEGKAAAAAPQVTSVKKPIQLEIQVSMNDPGLVGHLADTMKNQILFNGSVDILWDCPLKGASGELLNTNKDRILGEFIDFLTKVGFVQMTPVCFRWQSGGKEMSTKSSPDLWQASTSKLFEGGQDFRLSVKFMRDSKERTA